LRRPRAQTLEVIAGTARTLKVVDHVVFGGANARDQLGNRLRLCRLAVRFNAAPQPAAALTLAATLLLTGAMHEDGLADTADAWVGGHGDRERTLAIMKDPRAGAMAVIAIVTLLLLKLASMESLLSARQWGPVLIAPILGRAAMLLPAFRSVVDTRSYRLASGSGHHAYLWKNLNALLTRYKKDASHASPQGSLLFSCLGRGLHLFGKPDHDTDLFRRHLGEIPLGGFFCNGEIGPVHGSTFLHGYTSSFGIFRKRSA